MGITVKDVLRLDLFANSQILAGHKGLDNGINRVSVFDCPIQTERDNIVLKDGDFFISNFHPFKDDEDYALYAIKFIHSLGCACLCITNEYLDSFTDKLIKECNAIDFPVITIDYTTSYGDIMNSIMGLILEDQRYLITEMKISSLLDSKLSLPEIKSILNYINPHFSNFVTALYCFSNDVSYVFDKNLLNHLNKNRAHTAIPYKNGLLIFISYSNIDLNSLNPIIDFVVSDLKNNVRDYVIGISNNYIDINLCKNAIDQSLTACTSCHLASDSVIRYPSLGIYSLLFSFKDFDEVKQIYKDIILPIIDSDKKNNSSLLETLVSFVDNDGDYKKVSKELYQHENTVRYRILRIKSILNLEKSNVEFYEKISFGVKLYKIYNNNVKF